MKQTLADQVRAYMAHRGESYSPADLARDVARFQRDIPEKERCKRQNIETLLASDFKSVRYITALAQAMGTQAETLMAGKFELDATAALIARESAAIFQLAAQGPWPFRDVQPDLYGKLTDYSQGQVEGFVKSLLQNAQNLRTGGADAAQTAIG